MLEFEKGLDYSSFEAFNVLKLRERGKEGREGEKKQKVKKNNILLGFLKSLHLVVKLYSFNNNKNTLLSKNISPTQIVI